MKQDPSDREIREYTKRFDKNKTGSISRDDCMKILDERQANPNTQDELKEAMMHLAKGNNKIDVKEMRYIMTQLGGGCDEEVVQKMIEEVADEDVISIDKFCAIACGKPWDKGDAGKGKKGGGGEGKKKKKKK